MVAAAGKVSFFSFRWQGHKHLKGYRQVARKEQWVSLARYGYQALLAGLAGFAYSPCSPCGVDLTRAQSQENRLTPRKPCAI